MVSRFERCDEAADYCGWRNFFAAGDSGAGEIRHGRGRGDGALQGSRPLTVASRSNSLGDPFQVMACSTIFFGGPEYSVKIGDFIHHAVELDNVGWQAHQI